MKRLILLFATMMLGIGLSAQTQHGYVKTKGRLANDGSVIAGTRIPNATIQVKDRTPVVSQADGVFSFPIPAKNFYLTNVQKQGYVLTDPEMLSKQYSYSANDLIIVMEDLAQQEADRRAIERKISSKLYTQLLQQGEELDNLREQNKITEEKYRELLQQLNQYQDDNEKIIKDMAELYTKMDFDQIDEFNRKVSEYILNGELSKADSMLRTKGDLNQRAKEYQRHKAINAKEKEELSQRQEQLEQSELLAQKELEDLVNDCYRKFEICKMWHLNDSAAYYLELRASLDKTNVEWINDAGKFIKDYIGDYEKSLSFFEKALQINLTNERYDSSLMVESYNNIANNYFCQSKFNLALEYYMKSLLFVSNLGQETANLATCFNNIGTTWIYLGDYSQALDYANKALRIRTKLFDSKNPNLELADSYTTMSYIYLKEDNYTESLALAEQALNIRSKLLEPDHPDIANSFSNIAMIFHAQYSFQEALDYTKKALDIDKELFGESHPKIAHNYNNLGVICLDMGNYNNAIEYLNKALEIREKVLGTNHSATAITYNYLGKSYYYLKNYSEAIKYFSKSLKVREGLFGMNHPDVAESYHNIGSVYFSMGENSKAREYMIKALSIDKNIYGDNSDKIATSYDHIGLTYLMEKDYPKALDYCQHAIIIREKLFGQEDPRTAASYSSLGLIYDRQKNYSKAIEYFEKSIVITNKHQGKDNYDAKLTKQYLEQTLLKQKSSDVEEMKKYVCIATTIEGDTLAKQQGMDGEYIILEIDDWSIDSVSSLFEMNKTKQKKPTTLLVLKDNTIYHYYFEDRIGIKLDLKLVGTKEKEQIIELYHQWKSKKRD